MCITIKHQSAKIGAYSGGSEWNIPAHIWQYIVNIMESQQESLQVYDVSTQSKMSHYGCRKALR